MMRLSERFLSRPAILLTLQMSPINDFTQHLAMGVTVETLTPGDGVTFPKTGQTVTAHYTGTLSDGSKFDSSHDRGRPFQFTIGTGQVIQAWDEGMAKMSVGETAKLTCTPDYGYGLRGFPPVIPPNSNLVFEVQLIAVN